MSKSLLGTLLAASAAFALTSCGGGGGSGGAGLTSTPPPPPPPPPTTSPAIFPGITTNTDFAVLGLEASNPDIPVSMLSREGFAVRYDAAAQAYLIDLPATSGPATFVSDSEDAKFWHGRLSAQDQYLSVLKPTETNPEIALAYTSLGYFHSYDTPYGFIAFGVQTPSSGVPLTGTASYDAYVRGRTLNNFGTISGDATLQFNFGTGTLAGHFDPIQSLNGTNTNLGTYNFVSTVFGVGSTTFSGGLSLAGAPSLGAFNGQFTGPVAQELMARWTAPYLNTSTQQWSEMFGVWVGKKQ